MRARPRPVRGRWALSFADLCLLLLGFLVLLQASQATRDQALAGIGSYFGAIEAPRQADLAAASLFEPGEALLSARGHALLLATVRPFVSDGAVIHIQSFGTDRGDHRFDGWDLAAARLGAVARALEATGLPGARLRIAGLAENGGDEAPEGQVIRIVARPESLR
jgi:flagellar motor protein MotB